MALGQIIAIVCSEAVLIKHYFLLLTHVYRQLRNGMILNLHYYVVLFNVSIINFKI